MLGSGARARLLPSLILVCCLLATALLLSGCPPRNARPEVVIYISLDEPYARPVLEAFERDTGVRALPVYDTEASKSRGLALRIQNEMSHPRADVFWSSEVMQMLSLRQAGTLAAYRSPSAEGIPARYRDAEGYWTGFAARMRVLVYNTKRVPVPPRSLLELTDPKWRGQVAMADPLFGTTTTEAVALFQVLGADRAR
jgi:iron(III) transport system substrate-binding protein